MRSVHAIVPAAAIPGGDVQNATSDPGNGEVIDNNNEGVPHPVDGEDDHVDEFAVPDPGFQGTVDGREIPAEEIHNAVSDPGNGEVIDNNNEGVPDPVDGEHEPDHVDEFAVPDPGFQGTVDGREIPVPFDQDDDDEGAPGPVDGGGRADQADEGAVPGPGPADEDYLRRFGAWMQITDGGNVSVKTAETYVNAIKKVLAHVGGIDSFTERFSTIGNSNFLNQAAFKPGTIKSWIYALKKFVFFLKRNGLCGINALVHAEMQEDCKIWLRATLRRCRENHVRIMEHDAAVIPELKTSLTSKLQGRFADVMEEYLRLPALSNDQFSNVRDFLSLTILAENGQRIGIILNATVAEWTHRQEMADGTFTFRVAQHKSSRSHGAACLSVTGDTESSMSRYIEHRNDLLKEKRDKGLLFPNLNGNKQQAGAANARFRKLVDSDSLTSTRIRKLTVTDAREEQIPLLEQHILARTMTHTPIVAQRHYDVRTLQSMATTSAKGIRQRLYKK